MQPISTSTQVCAVIGNPVGHSLSPAIHNAAFGALGLDFVYVAFRVEDVEHALKGMRALENFRGMSITIPHKTQAMAWVDEIAEVDRSIGAINTVVNEDGRLVGLSTDGPGALKALADAGVELHGKRVLMLGAGGAARAIAFTLSRRVALAELRILDIDRKVLDALVADLKNGTDIPLFGDPFTDTALSAAMGAADVVVHCTPIGMHPQVGRSLVPPELFQPGQVVFDIVYTPLETRLLADARQSGLTVIPGAEMFVNQAALQFERFTGQAAPAQVMHDIVLGHLQT